MMRGAAPARRWLAGVGLALAALVGVSNVADTAPCWLPPVVGTVADPFRPPPCRWCPGNRGIEYRVGHSTVVRAVAAGVVAYAGSIAGVTYVVVRHVDGRRVTYGQLTERSVDRGDRVVARARLGRASGSFHFGVRVGDRYVDPAPFIGRVVGRPRLVPVDGSRPRASAGHRVRCATASGSR